MALYSQDFLERVRSANELVQVAASYNVQLKRAGSNMLGLCPFHNEKTPSFNIRPAEQFFRCFGCGAKGDVFRFVQMLEKVEFPEAVRLLAERAGLPLEYDSPDAARDAARQGRTKSALLWCCSRALDYFEERLAGPEGREGREYLLSRGFDKETIARWRLGWAPDNWDGLCGFFLKSAKEQGQKEKVLEYAFQAGVVRAKEDDRGGRRYYDAFRGRVMFPILDSQFRPIAFGGRVLEEKPEAGGKYINSPEGRLFEKRRVLFGLAQAAKEIALTGEAVVVEGYTDVIMCHQYGIRNVVATLGTSLTEDHVGLLRRHVAGKGRVTVFFDTDSAGEKATWRAIGLFMAQDVPLSVARDLDLKDAGDFLPRHGSDEFRNKLAQAEDGFAYVISRTIGRARGRDLSAMGSAVREAMDIVNLCPDPVKRALMRQRVAAEAGVPEETLPQPAEKAVAGRVRGPVGAEYKARPARKPGLAPPVAGLEMEDALERGETAWKMREARLLRYMWEGPEWCARIADAYPPDEWRDSALAELAAMVRDEWDAERPPAINAIRSRVENPEASERLADLAFPDNEPLKESEVSGILSLFREKGLGEELWLMRGEIEQAQKSGDEDRAAEVWAEQIRLKRLGGKSQ